MVPAAIPTDGYGDTLTKPGEPVLPPGTYEGEGAITPQEGPVRAWIPAVGNESH